MFVWTVLRSIFDISDADAGLKEENRGPSAPLYYRTLWCYTNAVIIIVYTLVACLDSSSEGALSLHGVFCWHASEEGDQVLSK